jgi:hypothetical protein
MIDDSTMIMENEKSTSMINIYTCTDLYRMEMIIVDLAYHWKLLAIR